uniref:hypothetical protein n=1 Tax=uncultured Draconibacterium sp. TaxID=1573823 RepID=UPI00321688B6
MRKIYLLLTLFLMPTGFLFAQEALDQAQILQLCIDLPELQNSYKSDQLYVMAHGVELSSEIDLSFKGKKVIFYDKEGIKSLGVSDFFLFWQFYVGDDSAKAIGQYVMNSGSEDEKSIPFELVFQKNEDLWEIIDFKIN